MKKITVSFYKSALGNEPVRDRLKALCKEDKIGERNNGIAAWLCKKITKDTT